MENKQQDIRNITPQRKSNGLDKSNKNHASKPQTPQIQRTSHLSRSNQSCGIHNPTSSRIRKTEQKALKHRSAKFTNEAIKDLGLWIKFIEYAQKGISINSIVFIRRPTSITLSDACETGMGGYNPLTGKAWRYKFNHKTNKFHSPSIQKIPSSNNIATTRPR